MKKLLLVLCIGLSLCACSKKESKPAVDLETDNTSPANVLSNMMDAANKATEGIDEEKPYYFSEGLKNAVSNCTPYSEDVYEKNPAMKQAASALLSMFSDKLDSSSIKFMFDVKGKQGDKCQVFLSYDLGFTTQDLNCSLSAEEQAKIVTAMNDKSTKNTTKKIDAGFMSTTTTGREFDFAMAEIMNSACQPTEQEPSEEKIKEMRRKILAFSDRFKNSLKTCTPDEESIKVMGIETNKVKIKGKEKGKCHVVLQGFHILLNDNELSLAGFDELGKLIADETRATYSPSYKYQGTLFALSRCEQVGKNNGKDQNFGSGKEELELDPDNIKLVRGVNSAYKNGACQLDITLVMTRNGKESDNSLRCEIREPQLSQYLAPYSKILEQYGPKITVEDNFFANSFGEQTDEVTAADKELFLKLYKEGICKKVN